ncbi:MAG: glycoside hydrolase [Gammaproteobacteria bacterium]|nr:glycoside hydrolase [Gammaproteobacteria bacterium]
MSEKLKLVICWHMHQPWYRESIDGAFHLPWVYLHALKDYTDMASHLESHPGMKCVVNFTPVLLEQIDEYALQCRQWLENDIAFTDPLLAYLAGSTSIPTEVSQRCEIIRACLRANPSQMIDPYPQFRKLLDMVTAVDDRTHINKTLVGYLNEQFFHDLLVWYHIAWLGYSVKQQSFVQGLINKESFYSEDDRRQFIGLFEDIFSSLIERYRKLAERDQVELAMTPYAHPIMPLLIDFNSMKDALPDAPMPEYDSYPDGENRARWHMQHGIEVFEKYFGRRPQGIWLSEGSISHDAIKLLDEFDIKWTASGEGVWHNSARKSGFDLENPETRKNLFGCNTIVDAGASVFFRDDGLSDLIGFEYQSWNSNDAVGDFISHIGNISEFLADESDDSVVSVILDGENAWEYYPDNGYHFLDALYKELSGHESIQVQTFAEAADSCPVAALPEVAAGSWVYGSFSTWIGEKDKNRGWDMLVEAKRVYDKHIASLSDDDRQLATLQLAVCEGSDWFWWFGDYNPSDSVKDFDQLYRRQLQRLYHLLNQKIPESLLTPISEGGGDAESAGTMRRGHET